MNKMGCNKTWLGLVLLLLFHILVSAYDDGHRYHFGSKTPYNIQGHIDWQRILQDEAGLAPTCKLIHVRLVARHGTRSPDIKNIEGVLKAQKKLKEALDTKFANVGTKEQFELRNATLAWKSRLPDGKRLIARGKAENEYLAREIFSLIDHHSTIFQHSNAFKFHTTEIPRSFESGIAFRDEFIKLINSARFAAASSFNVGNVTKNDDHLYFHKNCPAFTVNVEKNNATSQETKRIRLTPEALALVAKVNQARLGLTENVLEWNNIFALYQMAAFEYAALNGSVFMQLFDDDDLEFLEYADELDNFWKKAYGHPMIAEMSCVLTTNIFEIAERKIVGHPDFDGIFEFAHLETLLPVYAALGLYNDKKDDFIASAPREFIESRSFKMSHVGPFAGNFAFLFFVCPDLEEAYKNDYKVLFMVNGKLVPLAKACGNKLACPFRTVRQAYGLATGPSTNCNLRDICHADNIDKQKTSRLDDSSAEKPGLLDVKTAAKTSESTSTYKHPCSQLLVTIFFAIFALILCHIFDISHFQS